MRLLGIYCLWLSSLVVNLVTLHSVVRLKHHRVEQNPSWNCGICSPSGCCCSEGSGLPLQDGFCLSIPLLKHPIVVLSTYLLIDIWAASISAVTSTEWGSLSGGNGRLEKTKHRQFKEKQGPGGTLSSDEETMNHEHGLCIYFIGVG